MSKTIVKEDLLTEQINNIHKIIDNQKANQINYCEYPETIYVENICALIKDGYEINVTMKQDVKKTEIRWGEDSHSGKIILCYEGDTKKNCTVLFKNNILKAFLTQDKDSNGSAFSCFEIEEEFFDEIINSFFIKST
ncbi:MAG: hypothetical protein N2749_02050 [Clostridia bacterium]|nr:hypothetical protein [Clostridia bacterium]